MHKEPHQQAKLRQRLIPKRGIFRMIVLLVASFALFASLRPTVFLNPINLQNLMVASPEIGILAIAMTLTMLTGGIDLSLVAIANCTAITVSTVYTSIGEANSALAEHIAPLIMLVGLIVGLFAGLINGALISILGIAPILATLATMQIFNGLAIVWTGGRTLYGAPEMLTTIGHATVLGVPVLFVIFLGFAAVAFFLLRKTPFGRRSMLLGANPIAAKYSGIGSTTVLYGIYGLSGLFGGLAGLVFLARNPTASADYGSSYVLLVIVIAVLGGTNPSGGYATVMGVVLAVLVLQVVQSGFTSLRLSSYEYAIAQGVILLLVMAIDQIDWGRIRAGHHRSTCQ